MRLLPLALAALLLMVHAELWFGKGGVPHEIALRSELKQQLAENAEARTRNEQLAAEVVDLREGTEMVEEKARRELGMVRPDELLVVVAK
ncbi:MAG TPA: septum formation initiator family protein [Ideonella sp.]|uniref:septum formation initiator family protein n=1 Tax=Ideonella sp. TaxID=1929293 RepID=UPI002E2EB08F|nr:septum formation initiator family protein [Ideonella sp.]HEX5684825.1 septum formation initiator family protein [Ideonella sp.]